MLYLPIAKDLIVEFIGGAMIRMNILAVHIS